MSNASPRVEALEIRRLFIAALGGDDVIRISNADPSWPPRSYVIDINGSEQRGSFDADDTEMILRIECLDGDDYLFVEPDFIGRVIVRGGPGRDTLVGGSRSDSLVGDEDDDLLLGRLGADLLVGGGGADTLRGGGGIDTLHGDNQFVFINLVPDPGPDMLFGEDGADQLNGGAGDDLLNGGAGNDLLKGDGGHDLVYGGADDDSLVLARGQFSTLGGGGGNDLLDGGPGTDNLSIESLEAEIYVSTDGIANDGLAGEGANVAPTIEQFSTTRLAGGSVLNFSGSPAGVTVSLQETVPLRSVWVTFIGSPFADEMTVASFDPVQLDGRGGDDFLRGGSGDDSFYGGAGNDTIYGDRGNDVVLGEDGDDFIETHAGNDRVSAGVGDDTVWGDARPGPLPPDDDDYGSDILEGNAGNDVLVGGGNNDRIWGHGGNDLLLGGGGNDQMFGGPDAADTLRGGNGNDSAAEDAKDTYDSVETMLA